MLYDLLQWQKDVSVRKHCGVHKHSLYNILYTCTRSKTILGHPRWRTLPATSPTSWGVKNALVHQKQVLYIAKVGAAIVFDLHPYIVAPIDATDMIIHV